MVATPTFVAPLGDRLTGDRVRSVQDSRITSSRGPLWMRFHSPNRIAEAIADDMGSLTRIKPAPSMRPATGMGTAEAITDIGGDAAHIWVLTNQFRMGDVPSPVNHVRLYELSPIDFSVVRQQRIEATIGGRGVDGDNDVIYVGFIERPYTLRRLDPETFVTTGSVITGDYRAAHIAGDKDGCWIGDWTRQAIHEYTFNLVFVRQRSYPYANKGHRGLAIGGGSKRIYCTTIVEEDEPDWRVGTYIHTIRPADFAVIRTYGPFVSGRADILIGGM